MAISASTVEGRMHLIETSNAHFKAMWKSNVNPVVGILNTLTEDNLQPQLSEAENNFLSILRNSHFSIIKPPINRINAGLMQRIVEDNRSMNEHDIRLAIEQEFEKKPPFYEISKIAEVNLTDDPGSINKLTLFPQLLNLLLNGGCPNFESLNNMVLSKAKNDLEFAHLIRTGQLIGPLEYSARVPKKMIFPYSGEFAGFTLMLSFVTEKIKSDFTQMEKPETETRLFISLHASDEIMKEYLFESYTGKKLK